MTYKGFKIELNEYYNWRYPNTKYLYYSINDCDRPVLWAATIHECKKQIDFI
jgi:hypothetical protein